MNHREALTALMAHFEKAARGETIGETDLQVFAAASKAIAHRPVSLAALGSWVLDHTMAQYQAHLDAIAVIREISK